MNEQFVMYSARVLDYFQKEYEINLETIEGWEDKARNIIIFAYENEQPITEPAYRLAQEFSEPLPPEFTTDTLYPNGILSGTGAVVGVTGELDVVERLKKSCKKAKKNYLKTVLFNNLHKFIRVVENNQFLNYSYDGKKLNFRGNNYCVYHGWTKKNYPECYVQPCILFCKNFNFSYKGVKLGLYIPPSGVSYFHDYKGEYQFTTGKELFATFMGSIHEYENNLDISYGFRIFYKNNFGYEFKKMLSGEFDAEDHINEIFDEEWLQGRTYSSATPLNSIL